MPLLSGATSVRLGAAVVGRLYLGNQLVWPQVASGALTAVTPRLVAAISDGAAQPPAPRRAALVVSPRRSPHIDRPGLVRVLSALVAARPGPVTGALAGVTHPATAALTDTGARTALVNAGRVDLDVIGA